MAKGRKSKKVVRQLICDCETTENASVPSQPQWGKNCQCYLDGVSKFKALQTFIHKV
jgi:hypothetical protein